MFFFAKGKKKRCLYFSYFCPMFVFTYFRNKEFPHFLFLLNSWLSSSSLSTRYRTLVLAVAAQRHQHAVKDARWAARRSAVSIPPFAKRQDPAENISCASTTMISLRLYHNLWLWLLTRISGRSSPERCRPSSFWARSNLVPSCHIYSHKGPFDAFISRYQGLHGWLIPWDFLEKKNMILSLMVTKMSKGHSV